MVDFITPSGVKLEISLSDYSTCFDLLREVRRAQKNGSVETIDVCIDPAVDKLIFKCLERATYNGLRINRDTFESEQARGDYFFISDKVLDVNLHPFVSRLSSGSEDMSPGKKISPASK
jgi:hypothetical protein